MERPSWSKNSFGARSLFLWLREWRAGGRVGKSGVVAGAPTRIRSRLIEAVVRISSDPGTGGEKRERFE